MQAEITEEQIAKRLSNSPRNTTYYVPVWFIVVDPQRRVWIRDFRLDGAKDHQVGTSNMKVEVDSKGDIHVSVKPFTKFALNDEQIYNLLPVATLTEGW